MSLSNLLQEMQTHQAQVMAKAAKAKPLPDDPDGDEDDNTIRDAASLANGDNAEQELGGDDFLMDGDGDGDGVEEGADGDALGENENESETVIKGAPRTKRGAALAKSFRLALDDGEEIEAFDATELVKSLHEELGSLRNESLTVMRQAFDLIKAQNATIAGLKSEVSALGMSGRGRRSVLSVSEKSSTSEMAKSMPREEAGVSKAEFFAKAATAQRAGRLSAQDISLAEAYSSKGMAIPERIIARVMGD